MNFPKELENNKIRNVWSEINRFEEKIDKNDLKYVTKKYIDDFLTISNDKILWGQYF